METLKKWFNFSDTLNGTNFLIRWVIATLLQYPGGYLLGLGLAGANMGYTMIGLIVASLGIALQFSTLLKRSNALFSTSVKAFVFYFTYLAVSIFRGFAQSMGQEILLLTNLTMVLMFLYAIFRNSRLANHEG